mgnify:CR=1 FL=1
MANEQSIKVFAGTSNPDLARKISELLDVPLGAMRSMRFSDGEMYVEVGENVRNSDVYIVQSTCTPSRAALMTGRYSANTGLIFAMLPGSLAGLRMDQPTMPEVLGKQGYHAHMVGKWHLGHAQWQQTPVGRGFRSHVGSYMWSMEVWPCGGWQLRHAGVA